MGASPKALSTHRHLRLVAALFTGAAAAIAVSSAIGLDFGAARSPRAATSSAARPDVGRIIGLALAHRPTDHESLAKAERDADEVPSNARIDIADNTVSFFGTRADLTIVASPPTGTDMAFRAAGLEDPTINVRRGTLVTIRLVNGDRDSAHGWMLLCPVVEVGGAPHGPRAFPGAFAPMLGDPTAAGQPLETISFRAGTVGSYVYACPVPGHAAMGMRGRFVVRR
jgi:FtsP/CotA-like multicopper oxidase with cupredoxin domain